jgi:predicted deacylase
MPEIVAYPITTALPEWPAAVDALPVGRYRVQVPVARLLSGHDLELTMHILRGGEGPVLGLIAGIHGDETPGVRCIRDVLATLSPDTVRGTIVAVPVANPLAWQAQQRVTPERAVDQANLARVFDSPMRAPPRDDRAASLTRRIAATLERTVYRAITHQIDFHCYGRETMVRIGLYRMDQEEHARAMSARMVRSFGVGVMQEVRGSPGTTAAYAAERAIPTCVVEMGGTHVYRESDDAVVRLGRDGALRVMRTLGMIEAAPEDVGAQLVVERTLLISPQTSGYYLPAYDLEDLFSPEYPHGIAVQGGQALGSIFDAYTLETAETLLAPEDGYLYALMRGGPYQVGGPALSLAIGHSE